MSLDSIDEVNQILLDKLREDYEGEIPYLNNVLDDDIEKTREETLQTLQNPEKANEQLMSVFGEKKEVKNTETEKSFCNKKRERKKSGRKNKNDNSIHHFFLHSHSKKHF